jgi:hypothetical protein
MADKQAKDRFFRHQGKTSTHSAQDRRANFGYFGVTKAPNKFQQVVSE